MSNDPFSIASLHPEEDVPYTPSPLGARIVHSLVNINYMPDPLPPSLPNEWLIAIEAVRKVRETDQYTRWRAFMEATKEFPYSMIDEVNAYNSEQTVDRAEKDRILYRLKDVIQPPPPREWIVDGILSRSSLNLLVGDPGSKKTYMAIDLAFCVAMGKPWLGCPIGTSGIPSPLPISSGNQGDNSQQSEPLQRRENRKADQEDSIDALFMRRGVWGQCNAPSGGLGVRDPQGRKCRSLPTYLSISSL